METSFFRPLLAVLAVILAISSIVDGTVLPPRLSTSSKKLLLKEGQKGVVLDCSLDVGDSPVSYRWLKKHKWVTGSLGFAYRGYRKVHLALHEIIKEHEGIYVCEASNDAGMHSQSITVTVENNFVTKIKSKERPEGTEDILSKLAASLGEVLAEGNCHCDAMFLLHASPDIPDSAISIQANLVHTIADTMSSENLRTSVLIYSDYVTPLLTFGQGNNRCALRQAFAEMWKHQKWATRLGPTFREVFKRFMKSKAECKVLFLPVFGSIGGEGPDVIGAQQLKKAGVKIFILEVTLDRIPKLPEMASQRGDGRPYHWHIPYRVWPTIAIYMKYMVEELTTCVEKLADIPEVCIGEGSSCSASKQCLGAGMACIEGKCQSLQCDKNPKAPGCCATVGEFWCGDVTMNCTAASALCDGQVHCMNAADEVNCWPDPCPDDKVGRCQSSIMCLSRDNLCDGVPDCPGHEDEDERYCLSFPCPEDRQFRCGNGKCLAPTDLCDGAFKNCENGEDEELNYCSRIHTCPVSQPFKCDYGVCIPESMICDGVYNCLDASDEIRCSEDQSCPAERPFKCDTGKCVDLRLVCNGLIDACDDGSDEKNCSSFACPIDRGFKCENGICIDSWLKCDRHDDCGDKSDELGCITEDDTSVVKEEEITTLESDQKSSLGCYNTEYECQQSGACIDKTKVCNGRRDCLGGDDEENCGTPIECPFEDSFHCDDGTCIPKEQTCDGVADCDDKSDEFCSPEEYDEGVNEEETALEHDIDEGIHPVLEEDDLKDPNEGIEPSSVDIEPAGVETVDDDEAMTILEDVERAASSNLNCCNSLRSSMLLALILSLHWMR